MNTPTNQEPTSGQVTPPMQISKETKDRIAKEAQEKFPRQKKVSKEVLLTNWAEKRGYIAGAETWAAKCGELVEVLEVLRKHPRVTYQMEGIIDEALSNYNNRLKERPLTGKRCNT